jgi:ABC-type glycerol-3-phosphate transport system substrate-binding protein
MPPPKSAMSSALATRSSSFTLAKSVVCAPDRTGSPLASASSANAAATICSGVWCSPVIKQCRQVQGANPNIDVKITRLEWDDYRAKLTNGFIAGDAPDVFTDHLSKYPRRLVTDQQLLRLEGSEAGLAPPPIGPTGKRASMYNGLADSVWVGSQTKPAAVKWVEFLGSPECQNIVGEKAVVFPAIPEATEKAEAA